MLSELLGDIFLNYHVYSKFEETLYEITDEEPTELTSEQDYTYEN